ncbi:hypothetical protein MPH_08397 [Macrophomina phaseolina MS6]|uniref:General substrate transporter n=1 Tax=Macrophomina phaseolina (strain MS6) TaxID=1126212 RepID=K2RIH6_MACPH|nr:hypothetical protein MPH_08397 [Macrophomina phaseolina MS6]
MSKEFDQTVMAEKSKSESDGEVVYHEHVDIKQEGKAVNPFLIFTCTVFAAASFLFGFDDKVISPIIALEPFVSPHVPLSFSGVSDRELHRCRSTSTRAATLPPAPSSLPPATRTCSSPCRWSAPSSVLSPPTLSTTTSAGSGPSSAPTSSPLAAASCSCSPPTLPRSSLAASGMPSLWASPTPPCPSTSARRCLSLFAELSSPRLT